jgi:hypothetical protein
MTNNMNNSNKKRTVALAVLAGVAVVLGTAGCSSNSQHGQQVSHGEQFTAEGTPRSVDKFVNAQIASGARNDAMLNVCHFDGNQLNSLGREKLRAMLKDDDACEPLTVYVNVAGQLKPRREAVTAFLMDEGLLETQIQLKEGVNPATVTPAVKAMKAFAISDGDGAAVVGAPTPVSATALGSGGSSK